MRPPPVRVSVGAIGAVLAAGVVTELAAAPPVLAQVGAVAQLGPADAGRRAGGCREGLGLERSRL